MSFPKKASLILFQFLLFGFLASAYSQTAPEDKLPVDSKITVGKLKNGLTYYIRQNAKPENRAELRLVVNAGSILEDDDQRGVAHFVEHMAFNGTKNFEKQEIIDYLELIGTQFGPDLNAYTSFDETVYMLKVPTDSTEIMEKTFHILSDWAQNVSFDAEEMDKERGVVIEEWRGGRGASARMLDKQFPLIFKDSHYADRLIIGTKESLENFTHEAARRYYKDWYRPDLMALIAVGDFEKSEIETLIKKYFDKIPAGKKARERKIYEVPDHEETLYALATDPEAPQSLIGVYFKHPPAEEGTYGAYRKSLVSSLYNGMLNNRFQEMSQKPDSPFIIAFSQFGNLVRPKGTYMLNALVRNGEHAKGLEGLLTEAQRVDQFGFTASEFERQKTNMMRGMERAYEEREKTESRAYASEFVRAFLMGESTPGIEYELELYKKFLPGITLEEVNALGKKWITDGNRVIVSNSPEKADVHAPTEDELRAAFANAAKSEVTAFKDEVADKPLFDKQLTGGKVVSEKKYDAYDITEWRLSNGVKVVLKPTDFKEDEVLLSASSPGGSSLSSDEEYGAISGATAAVARGGVGEFNMIQLQKLLTGKVVRVSPYISGLEEGFSGSASPKDLETAFQMIYLYFTEPRKDAEAFEAFKMQMKGFLANRSASPETAFADTISVTLADYHPRSKPFSAEMIDAYDLDKSIAFYKDRFADASDFTFYFVGNFTLEGMKPLAESYLGGLPSINREENWKDVGVRAPKGVIKKVVRKGQEPKAQAQITFTGSFEFNYQNRFDLRAMADVLDIMLRETLREDLGGTYGVRVSASPSKHPRESYSFTIRFGCDPERQEELLEQAFKQIEDLKKNGPSEKNLAKVQETQRRSRETSDKENRTWLFRLSFYPENGESYDEISTFDDKVNNLSAKAIQKAAQKYLNLENFVQVRLLPESGE